MTLRAVRTNGAPAPKIDPTTGLGNAAMFSHEVDREIARFNRSGEPFSILILTTGNPTGKLSAGDPSRDTVVAQKLHGIARVEDAPCHLQGRWFGVVLAGAQEKGARAVLERVREATDWQPGQSLTEPLTGGVAEWNGAQGADELVQRAYDDLDRYNAAFSVESTRWRPHRVHQTGGLRSQGN